MARLKALELRKTQAMERIEAKLDALLKLNGVDPAKVEEAVEKAPESLPAEEAVEKAPESLPAEEAVEAKPKKK